LAPTGAGTANVTEAQSVTTFVMGARLPWPDDAPVPAESGPLDAGVVHDNGSRQDCSIRKISSLGATLRGELRSLPGDGVAIELATGQRPAGTIEWVRGGETGIRFDQPVDVLALINRKLVSQTVERRAMPRVEIRCGAYLKWAADTVPVALRNISARGLQIEGGRLPAAGTYVSPCIEGLVVPPGEVAWRKDNLAGIELLEELSWTSIMPWIRDQMRKQAQ
jgi:hypothetical protein